MMTMMLGKKGRMTATFVDGVRVPVTAVTLGPCVVTQVKNKTKDGYWAVQLGFGEKRLKNTSKPLQGHLKQVSTKTHAPRFLREVRITEEPTVKVGDKLLAHEVFQVGDKVTVMGISKGKGFAGVVKRWHFAGGSKTHGQSDRQRAPGSIGQGTSPGRVYKGKHMAGRMGSDTKTVKNLKVMSIDQEKNIALISGAIPGPIGSLVVINK